MIRKFNYTDRKRIRHADVSIYLKEKGNRVFFDADLSRLASEEYALPRESLVFVEAYRQTTWMRFPFGRVGSLPPPGDRELSEFEGKEGIKFRVKVISSAADRRILAEADGISFVELGKCSQQPDGLLAVKPEDLGDLVYRVDLENEPLLLINKKLGDYRGAVKHPAFLALVLPSVLREILVHIVLVECGGDSDSPSDESGNDWRALWVKFAEGLPGAGRLPQSTPDQQERRDWIDRCVREFAQTIRARQRFEQFLKEEASS